MCEKNKVIGNDQTTMLKRINFYLFLIILLMLTLLGSVLYFIINFNDNGISNRVSNYHLISESIVNQSLDLIQNISTEKPRLSDLLQLSDKINDLNKIQLEFEAKEFDYLIGELVKINSILSEESLAIPSIVFFKKYTNELSAILNRLKKLHIIERYKLQSLHANESKKEMVGLVFKLMIIFIVGFISVLYLSRKIRLILLKSEELRTLADKANSAKSDFLATMSHELRTPLNLICGMLDILPETKMDMEQKQYWSIFKGAANSLTHIINNILDVAKVESGQLSLESKNFNLKEDIDELYNQFLYEAEKKNVDLKINFDENLNEIRRGDSLRIKQVLYNLIGNAIKFTNRGHVNLNISSKGKIEDNILSFSLSDTGIGIPQDKLDKIFEKFTQVDSSIARTFGGTGLGLSITTSLLKMMGSELRVTSAESVGTTFYFELFLEPGDSNFKKEDMVRNLKSIEKINSKNRNVLIVDDCNDNRIFLKILLKKTSFNIIEATNGEEALKHFSKVPFDIVLMDMQMPIMDGYQTTKKMREFEVKTGAFPSIIIAISADALNSKVQKSLDLGCNYHLKKPLDKNEFLDLIEDVVSDFEPQSV